MRSVIYVEMVRGRMLRTDGGIQTLTSALVRVSEISGSGFDIVDSFHAPLMNESYSTAAHIDTAYGGGGGTGWFSDNGLFEGGKLAGVPCLSPMFCVRDFSCAVFLCGISPFSHRESDNFRLPFSRHPFISHNRRHPHR